MSKIKLSLATPPETVKHTITLLLPSGDEADLTIDYIYRSKKEFAEYFDVQAKKAKVIDAENKKNAKDSKRTRLDAYTDVMKENIGVVLEISCGWDLENEFNAENLELFENKYRGALVAIMQGYFTALQEVRIKN